MKIESIQTNLNFGNKKYPASLTKNIFRLKSTMEAETRHMQTYGADKDTCVRAVGIDGLAVFRNGKYFSKKTPENVIIPYADDTAIIEFGNVRLISDKSGEIIEYQKPFYKSWNKVFEQTQYYVLRAIGNYDNPSVITKQLYRNQQFKTLTQEVFDVIKSLIKMNPWR